MTPRLLEQFLALTESLHFGRASERVNVSHSALSRSIRQLEDEVGVRLFDRDNRSVSVTQEGHKFETYAREALINWHRIQRQLQGDEGKLGGEISLYCSVTASHSMLFDLLERLRATHPGIDIKLHTGNPEFGISRVQAGEEDFAIAARPANLPRGLSFQPLQSSPLVFIAPKVHNMPEIPVKGSPKNSDDWRGVPLILAESGLARTRVDQWFKAIKVNPKIYAQVSGNEAIVSMVSLGLGVGVVPKIVLDNSVLAPSVKIWRVSPLLEPYRLGLFTQTRRLHNPLVSAFWELTKPASTKESARESNR